MSEKRLCVAKVITPYKLVITLDETVKVGRRFFVYTESDEDIINPLTKENLGKLELPKGVGQITSVQDTMATLEACESIEKKEFYGVRQAHIMPMFSNYEKHYNSEALPQEKFKPFENPEIGDFLKLVR